MVMSGAPEIIDVDEVVAEVDVEVDVELNVGDVLEFMFVAVVFEDVVVVFDVKPPAPAMSTSTCDLLRHVFAPLLSVTQSLVASISFAKNLSMPLFADANHCVRRPIRLCTKALAYASTIVGVEDAEVVTGAVDVDVVAIAEISVLVIESMRDAMAFNMPPTKSYPVELCVDVERSVWTNAGEMLPAVSAPGIAKSPFSSSAATCR